MQHQQEEPVETSMHFLDYWRVIRSRKEIVLAVILLVVLTGTAYTLSLPKIYMAKSRISVHQDSLNVDVFERQAMPGYNPFFLRTQYQIIQSKPIIYQVIHNLNLAAQWGKEMSESGEPLEKSVAYELMISSLNIEQFRDTTLIDIKVYRKDREEASRIANEIAAVYRNHRLSQKRREMKGGIEALTAELDKQQEKVNEAEEDLERIRKELGITTMARGIRADKVRLAHLEGDRISAKVAMLVRKARLEQLEGLEEGELLHAAAVVIKDGTLTRLRQELIQSEVSLALMLQNFGEKHPDVLKVKAGLAELRKKLNEALNGLLIGLRSEYEVAKEQYQALEAELALARESDIEDEGTRYLPFDKADNNLKLQRTILNALKARVTQEGIEIQVPSTPVEIIDPAEPPKTHVSPNLFLNLVLSLLAGFVAGIGLAYFIEYLDTSVKTVDDVERYLGLSVLGVIPQKVRPLIEEGPDSPHAEAYRVLRTNMQFNIKGTGGAFSFVSGGVGEGKSTSLFNMAFVCAHMGDKVLIVDSDLRRPVQHTMLGMSNRFGLTNVLMRDVPIEETIKATSVPNLHFLPSGKLPRSSLGLLDSQRMRDLVKNLKARYDYVFFDSPPIVGVSDAAILASEVDGVFLVVQYRKYPRVMTSRAKRLIENVGGNLVGVVLNNINIMRDDYYYYYHSYYSHYYQSDESKPDDPKVPVAALDGKEDSV